MIIENFHFSYKTLKNVNVNHYFIRYDLRFRRNFNGLRIFLHAIIF